MAATAARAIRSRLAAAGSVRLLILEVLRGGSRLGRRGSRRFFGTPPWALEFIDRTSTCVQEPATEGRLPPVAPGPPLIPGQHPLMSVAGPRRNCPNAPGWLHFQEVWIPCRRTAHDSGNRHLQVHDRRSRLLRRRARRRRAGRHHGPRAGRRLLGQLRPGPHRSRREHRLAGVAVVPRCARRRPVRRRRVRGNALLGRLRHRPIGRADVTGALPAGVDTGFVTGPGRRVRRRRR